MKGAEVYATTTTDDSGLYSFSVPQGNYSGVRLSCDNFKSVSIAQSIALIANDYVTIGGEGSSTEMIATHVPVVRGRLSVKGLLGHDYSGIRVSLIENGMATTTDEDGYWSFAKVPVGNYTLKIERENTNVVTKIIDVVAAAEKNIETIELIPNAASIEGHVTLNGKTDHSGITVRATAEGMTELSTKTNAAGYFYLGNVVTTETYTLYFEKDGWVSLTRQVSGLEDLSLNDITEVNPIKLVDTANPELISISVVVGNSELEGRKLNVYFNASDEGSGLSKVYVNTCDDFTDIEAQNYSNPFSCYVDDTEGEHTLYIKVADAAGNLSEIVSQVFRISDFKTSVASVLLDNEDGANDGIITWTKNRSPYYVTGSILVDENTTLIIEPGVNVQFSGAHYIQVEGTIKIIGTESEKVYLYGVGNGENTWKGIKGVNDRGNCISFAVMTNMLEGMQGYLNISDCSISSVDGGYSVGGTSSLVGGTVKNSVINGGVSASDSLFDNCIIDVGSIEQIDENGKSIYECYLNDCQFSGEEITAIHCNIDNSAFSEMTIHLNSCDGIHSSFRDCKLSVKKSNNFFHAFGGYLRCVFDGCSFENFSSSGINESNIINCGVIKITTKKDEFDYLDFSRNYWGPTNTLELNNGVINLSFIEDYYDDFNNSRVEVTGYYSDEVENAGPLTVSRSDSTFVVGSEGPAGGIVFYDKGYYSDGWRYLEVSPNSFDNCCFGYNRTTDNGNNLRNGTGYGIGFGRYNTARIVENMGDIAYSSESGSSKSPIYAAKVCDDYQVNGYSDWFLPSISELNLIFNNLGSGILKNKYGHYWSSSDYFRLGAAMMTYVSDYASTDWNYSSFEYGVLPIRMF